MNKFILSEEAQKHLSDGSQIVVSVSGGKDSTATCLFLYENGYSQSDFLRVFADTGWESLETYEYLDEVEKIIGPITHVKNILPLDRFDDEIKNFILEEEERLGRESGFIRYVFKNYIFPSSLRKYCTRELKLVPIKRFADSLDCDWINAVGVRREESSRRSTVEEWEWNEGLNAWTWRPLYQWTEEDVIDIHHRFGIVPNQLYLNGSNRVGCWPCIYANKADIKLLDQGRLELIDRMERMLGKKGIEQSDPESKKHKRIKMRKTAEGHYFNPMFERTGSIMKTYEWSQTSRGGRQFELFDTASPTCAKWGMCDMTGAVRNFK
jgi:3'-phosphoadenosine 5'-phosphosulfate sulfotransferase (PAPS reductase)/FAD synthetase